VIFSVKGISTLVIENVKKKRIIKNTQKFICCNISSIILFQNFI